MTKEPYTVMEALQMGVVLTKKQCFCIWNATGMFLENRSYFFVLDIMQQNPLIIKSTEGTNSKSYLATHPNFQPHNPVFKLLKNLKPFFYFLILRNNTNTIGKLYYMGVFSWNVYLAKKLSSLKKPSGKL